VTRRVKAVAGFWKTARGGQLPPDELPETPRYVFISRSLCRVPSAPEIEFRAASSRKVDATSGR